MRICKNRDKNINQKKVVKCKNNKATFSREKRLDKITMKLFRCMRLDLKKNILFPVNEPIFWLGLDIGSRESKAK